MSINIARAAFAKGLGTVGQVQSCTMNYAVDGGGQTVQRFTVQYVKGEVTAFVDVNVPPMGDIDAAMCMAGVTVAQGD